MYKFDLHVHSFYSKDSIINPEKAISTAKKKGLSGIAITDHNTIRGGIETKKKCEDNFIVIVGSEITTDQGDIIGLFLNKEVKSHYYSDVIDEIKDQGGLVVLPHPYRIKTNINKDLINKVDAIEIFNARTNSEKNKKAKILAKEYYKSMVMGSDAHLYGEIGMARTLLKNITTEDIIKKQILSNKIKNENDLIIANNIHYRAFSVLLKKSELYKKITYKILKY